MRVLPLLPLLLSATAALAQTSTVVGTVTDPSGAPLPGVSVYLSGTTRGDATDAEGRYVLDGVEPGSYRLVASLVGYTAAAREVTLRPFGRIEVPLRLEASTLDLGAVRVEAERDRGWSRKLEWFTRVLIGETANAAETRILNPEVLTLRRRWGTLRAEAAAPLVIENRALGYRLTYDLHTFEAGANRIRYHGDERFEALTPADSAEGARWAAARERAYRGSQRHLLRALLAGTTEAEGFTLTLAPEDPSRPDTWRNERPVRPEQVIRVDGAGWGVLTLQGRLGITYHDEAEEPEYLASEWFRERRSSPAPVQRSTLTARGRVRVDPQGTPDDPFGLVATGYLAYERLADLVPEEYASPTRRNP